VTERFYEWARAEERGLARFVREDLPAALRLPSHINRLDWLTTKGKGALAGQVYAQLQQQGIRYDLAPFNPRSGVTQRIRTPETILGEKVGTCLDLTLLFAGACLANDLLPLVVVVDGHAFAAVSLTRTRHDTRRAPKALAFERGLLADFSVLKDLAGSEYLLVECTGLAQSGGSLSTEFPEGRGRDAGGLMSFERACEAGLEQVAQHARAEDEAAATGTRAFLFALDIHDLQVNHAFTPEEVEEAPPAAVAAPAGDEINVGDVTSASAVAVGRLAEAAVGVGAGRMEAPHQASGGGDRITVGNISGSSGIAIGGGARASVHTGPDAEELKRLFAEVHTALGALQTPAPIRASAAQAVQEVEKEAAKGDQASEKMIEEWLTFLGSIAPDIVEVVAATFASPVAGVAKVIGKIAARARKTAG
jgi:hypothetical protein